MFAWEKVSDLGPEQVGSDVGRCAAVQSKEKSAQRGQAKAEEMRLPVRGNRLGFHRAHIADAAAATAASTSVAVPTSSRIPNFC